MTVTLRRLLKLSGIVPDSQLFPAHQHQQQRKGVQTDTRGVRQPGTQCMLAAAKAGSGLHSGKVD